MLRAKLVEWPHKAWQPTETENHAALPVPLKTEEKTKIAWIPVAIAVLQVIKESMDD
ncbi:MAG: hypothetical protein HDR50_04190 [Desulfovibrio sp.]|uniref:hypothetical protein n=1 Tax=Desulfovibrio sp. TaxID=885 RepID=UPI001A79FE66|nr:hypothetical protein [Desulfovibrio sp.]MBD5416856.1 hypothetical protein [Desulfovibrio sp.]